MQRGKHALATLLTIGIIFQLTLTLNVNAQTKDNILLNPQTKHQGETSVMGIETSPGNIGRLYQIVTDKLKPGQQCQITGWIKTSNVQGTVTIGLDYATSPYYPTPVDGWIYQIGNATGTTDWTYYESQPFIVPPMPKDTNALLFLFDFAGGSGTAWWDDVQLIITADGNPEIAKTAWTPPAASGVAATAATIGVVGASAIVAAAVSTVPAATAATATSANLIDKIVGKVRDMLPSTVKKWLESLIASKRKSQIEEKTGKPYLLTKPEIIVYTLAIFILTFSFAYVKVNTLTEFLIVLPTFIVTSLIVALIRTYILTTYARTKGVWAEYKLWYFGIIMFIFSTIAFRLPFSSPTRNVYHTKNMTPRIGFNLAIAGIAVTLGFAVIFLLIQNAGFALIGSSGLGMCLIAAFFDTLPIKPMGGATIFQYNKKYWLAIFLATLILYSIWLLQTL